MTVSKLTLRQLKPFMDEDVVEELVNKVECLLTDEVDQSTPPHKRDDAELIVLTCCEELVKGWQAQQKRQSDETRDLESKVDCSCRVSKITPARSQLVAVCQGPSNSLREMELKMMRVVKRVVKKELKGK